jgi:signal transduction histidine kinase
VTGGGGIRARLALQAAAPAALAFAAAGAAAEWAVLRPLGARRDPELAARLDGLAARLEEGGEPALERAVPDAGGWWILVPGRGGSPARGNPRIPPGAASVVPGGPSDLPDPVAGPWRVQARRVGHPDAGAVIVAGLPLGDLRREEADLRLLLWIAAAGGVLLVAGGAYAGATRVLGPLRRIVASVRAAPREGARVASPGSGDEFDDLARLLDDLLLRQGEALEEERRFASEAAHELRAPLAVLRLRLEDALADGDAAAARRAMEQALADCDRIGRLVQALLELSRAAPPGAGGAGRGSPAPSCDPAEVAAGLAPDLEALCRSRGHRMAFDPPPAGLAVAAPREVLETCLSVLVDNALRYTPPGGEVRVRGEAGPAAVTFRVEDDGAGVPGAEAPRIFDRLFRGAAAKGVPGGFGLGLPLARRLARSCGGDVVLENPGEPRARFRVDLPLV